MSMTVMLQCEPMNQAEKEYAEHLAKMIAENIGEKTGGTPMVKIVTSSVRYRKEDGSLTDSFSQRPIVKLYAGVHIDGGPFEE